MKIALVCPYNMFERAGGVHQVIIHLHDGLVKKGHVVKIITPKPAGFRGRIPEDYILLGTSRTFNGGFGTAGNWGMEFGGSEIEAVLKKEKFDVINFHEPWAPMLAWQMLGYSTAAHVGTFHANLVDSVAAKSWVNMFIRYGRGIGNKMHVITAVSPAPAALLISKASKKAEKEQVANIHYIPNGIDLSVYKPYKKRLPLNGPGTKTIVFVGRLEKRKGVEWLIKAYVLLAAKMPNAYLIIAGEGGQLDSLEEQVRSAKLRNVHFAGYVDDEEKRRLMGNADLVCSPALFGESFGIVLVEAMAMEAPLLGGNNLGYINVMTGYGRLGLVDPKATEDFANRLGVFLTDERLRKSFRHWELNEVKKYDYTKIVEQYEQAYMEALSKWRAERHLNGENAKNGKKSRKTKRRFLLRRQPR
jgi:phosphatidylinositol alpha-mannosyltransferase